MDFELNIRIGDKAFGGTVTITDWKQAPNEQVAEQALRRALEHLYNKAIEDVVKEAMNG